MNLNYWERLQDLHSKYNKVYLSKGCFVFSENLLRPQSNECASLFATRSGGFGCKYTLGGQLGQIHRPSEEGPAYESFFANGRVESQQYFWLGERHRPMGDGPACITFSSSGVCQNALYYFRDEYLGSAPIDIMNQMISGSSHSL
jgi:hypothetical protein